MIIVVVAYIYYSGAVEGSFLHLLNQTLGSEGEEGASSSAQPAVCFIIVIHDHLVKGVRARCEIVFWASNVQVCVLVFPLSFARSQNKVRVSEARF